VSKRLTQVVSIEDYSTFLEIIDPYSINQQGNDIGEKYRTGIYSNDQNQPGQNLY
jgi:peptide-methionine (S)-S-oxide reductase